AAILGFVHPSRPPMMRNRVIKIALRSRRHTAPIPGDWHLKTRSTYSLSPFFELVRSWGDLNTMSLETLQRKAIFLITIATFWRPTSDIGRLQYRVLRLRLTLGPMITLKGLDILSREPKEARYKVSNLGMTSLKNLDPVKTLWIF
ncbi:hypothetical protein DM01DRAFT_1274679, partial [Hesseltinella vesiculosa]